MRIPSPFPFVIGLLFWGGIGFLCFSGTKVQENALNKATATVSQVEGFLIFAYSKPNTETNYLGTVNVPNVISDKAEERLKRLIKFVKKDFPKAEALIVSDDFSKADAITFKDDK